MIDYIWAFVVGGLLCVVAQVLIDKTKLTPARILVIYVMAGRAYSPESACTSRSSTSPDAARPCR